MLQDLNANSTEWETWAGALQRWGLKELAASILEAAGPLTLLGAQAVYLCRPFVNGIFPSRHLDKLVEIFEDSAKTEEFTAYLREGINS